MTSKFSLAWLILLLSQAALASPVTTDYISAPDGLTIQSNKMTLTLPEYRGEEALLSQNSTVSVQNKTFDATSNVFLSKRVVWDYATMGGATGANVDLVAGLPAKAIIRQVWLDILTQPASWDSATVAISAQNSGDIYAATAVAAVGTGLKLSKVVSGNTNAMIRVIGATGLTLNVGTGGLYAGKIAIFIDYMITQ